MVAIHQLRALTVLADSAPWQQMGNHFKQGGSSADLTSLLVVLGAIAVFVFLLCLVAKFMQRDSNRPYRSGWRLFLELCRAHRLSWSDSWLLWRLAASQGLQHKSVLFLEPERFIAPQVSTAFAHKQPRLNELRMRLFEPRDGSET